MTLRNIINNAVTENYFVAEVVNKTEIRVPANYVFKADAEAALRRMPKGNYVVKKAGGKYENVL